MNFGEMQDFLAERTRNHTTAKLANIKSVLNMSMRTVANQRERHFLSRNISMNTVSAQHDGYVVDDQEVEKIKRIYIPDGSGGEGLPMTELPIEVLLERYPDSSESAPGCPDLWAVEKISGVKADPSSASALAIVSSSTSDTTQTVKIVGIVSSLRLQEIVTLTGQSAASTNASFTEIYSIKKSARTEGSITVTSNTGSVTNAVIPADAFGSRYIYFKVHTIPDGVYTMNLNCVRRLHDMVDDGDIPGDMFDREYQDAVLALAESIILKDPAMASVALNTDKEKGRVHGTVGLRTVDRRSYRNKLEMGRYRGS